MANNSSPQKPTSGKSTTAKSTTSKSTSTKSTATKSTATKSTSTKPATTKSSGKSTDKANANRVVKAVKKYDTDKSLQENSQAVVGIVSAAATSAKRSKGKTQKIIYIVIAVVLVLAIVGVLIYGYYGGWFNKIKGPQNPDNSGNGNLSNGTVGTGSGNGGGSGEQGTVIESAELSIHFMELGNANTGDSVYIKAGNTDILIDAGSRAGSAATISSYVNQYCTDGILEYVIVTHAHQDHIEGFVGNSSVPGIFARYKCGTIIEFARTGQSLTTASGNPTLYSDYVQARTAEVNNDGATCYTALQCAKELDGAQKVYNLTEDGSIKMEILYQKYYEENTSNENNYSVCMMLTQGSNHYLFTGDLEGGGETSLVNSNPNLPKMVLYKGGHHGSYTAASNILLEKIQPEYVCICCCAGNTEYTSNKDRTFPAQEFINRVAYYTDKVYVTTLGDYNDRSKYESMNGNIVLSCVKGEIKIQCSNNDLKLKDTEWFKNNRTCPAWWQD